MQLQKKALKKPKKEKPFDKKAWAIAALRRASYKLRSRQEAIKLAKVDLPSPPKKDGSPGKQKRVGYRCNDCNNIFQYKETRKDHIVPIVPLTGWDNFDGFIERIALEHASGWQILCKACHKKKTLEENEIRRQNAKE